VRDTKYLPAAGRRSTKYGAGCWYFVQSSLISWFSALACLPQAGF